MSVNDDLIKAVLADDIANVDTALTKGANPLVIEKGSTVIKIALMLAMENERSVGVLGLLIDNLRSKGQYTEELRSELDKYLVKNSTAKPRVDLAAHINDTQNMRDAVATMSLYLRFLGIDPKPLGPEASCQGLFDSLCGQLGLRPDKNSDGIQSSEQFLEKLSAGIGNILEGRSHNDSSKDSSASADESSLPSPVQKDSMASLAPGLRRMFNTSDRKPASNDSSVRPSSVQQDPMASLAPGLAKFFGKQ